MNTEEEWQPIETAPKDAHPVWARGWDFGKEGGTRHYCWAYWNGSGWYAPAPDGSSLLYLTDWRDAP